MVYDKKNVFARILKGELPCKKVYEDDFAIAFHDLYPAAPVHVLVVPRGEYVSFDDFSENASHDEVYGFFKAVKNTIKELNISDTGYRLISNHGVDGAQTVPHFHMHILAKRRLGPIVEGDFVHHGL
jgi:diadenosine tetraphosphate (Ap4A) HIT family hydrolase